MSHYQSVQQIVHRLRSELPLHITLPDPVSGADFTVVRENLFSDLVIDTPNLLQDAQSCAAQYLLMARCQRACERAAASSESAYVKWKAERSEEFRRRNADRKVTVDEATKYYQTHADYEQMNAAPTYYGKLAGLFEDAKEAFRIKSRLIEMTARYVGGATSTEHAASRVEDAPMPPMPPSTGRTPKTRP